MSSKTDAGYQVFSHLTESLTTEKRAGYKDCVSRQDYNNFCFEYLWDQLRGTPFGVAFCEKFSINDVLLIHTTRDEESAKRYIERAGYIEAQVD